MLSMVSAGRVCIGLSLLAAACAGYVAGRQAVAPPPRSAPLLCGTTNVTAEDAAKLTRAEELTGAAARFPHAVADDVTAARVDTPPAPASRADTAAEMMEVQTWPVLVRPNPAAKQLFYRLEVREAGRASVPLLENVVGQNLLPGWKSGTPEPIEVSLMPVSVTLTKAEQVRFQVKIGGLRQNDDKPNPFRDWFSMGNADGRDGLKRTLDHLMVPGSDAQRGEDAGKVLADVPLTEVKTGDQSKRRTKVLYLTFRTERGRPFTAAPASKVPPATPQP